MGLVSGDAIHAPSCIVVLGGSFDPVHNGHVAMARYLSVLLCPDELRVLPAGNPWQKAALQASVADRIAMLGLAFADLPVPVIIDRREIERSGPTYTVDTLRELRAELGDAVSIVFAVGADQLQRLHTWNKWESLFLLANLCVVSRPGFATGPAAMTDDVRLEFARRAATPTQLRATAHGLTLIADGLAVDISSTQLRAGLRGSNSLAPLLPASVLDYIQQHHLYRH